MVTFVWVFGPTAVGKDTFINKLAGGELDDIVKELKLEVPFVAHKEALNLRHGERKKLAETIASESHGDGTVLLKWQGADMEWGNVHKLLGLTPDARFIYLFLDAAPEIIKNRRLRRGSPDSPGWDDNNDRRAAYRLAKEFEKNGVDFVWLDNNGDEPVFSSDPNLEI